MPLDTATVPPELTIMLREMLARGEERDFIIEFVDRSDDKRSRHLDMWDEILDNYFVSPLDMNPRSKSKPPLWHGGGSLVVPDRNLRHTDLRGATLKDPETHQIIEALTAQVLGLVFSGREYLQVTPVGADDPEKARLLQRLLTAVLEQPGNFRTFYQLLKESFTLGTGVMQIGWDNRSRVQMQRRPLTDDLGLLVGFGLTPEDVVYRDGPLIEVVDLYDFYPDPNGTRIHRDMAGVAKRFRLTKQQAREMAAAGIYNKAAVERAIQSAAKHDNSRIGNEHGGNMRPNAPIHETAKGLEPLIGFEYWGRVPYKPLDGYTNRVVTLLEGEVVRSHINPFLDGGVPFKEITVNPVAGRFYGVSPGEVIRFLQDSADHFLMVASDAADLMTRGPLLVGGGFGGDEERLKARRFMDIIRCANPDMVKPIPNDYTALGTAINEYVRNKMTMREATGATNPLQAIPTSDRQTATEISQLVRYASQRGELMAQIIEREDFPWIGRTLHSRLRQFLPNAEILTVLNGEPLRVPFEAVDFDADVRFSGTQMAQTKAQKVMGLREALTVLGTAPQIAMFYPSLVARYLEALDIPDAAAQVQAAQQVFQMQAQMQAMQGAAGGAPSGSPSQPKSKAASKNEPESAEASRNGGEQVAA